jgi:predicted DsbA family dithiol-disulfide isomerase
MVSMKDKLSIDVVSDVICPWCFLGKRHLDRALEGIGFATEVTWRPFFLDPSIPDGGISRADYMRGKFGSDERIKELHKPLRDAGAKAGLAYEFEKIAVTPNTMDAHRLIRWAKDDGGQSDLVETLFRLYWIEGEDIGDRNVLAKVSPNAARLATDEDRDTVMDEVRNAQSMGVSGVPTFIIAKRYAISGAHPPETLRGAIARAHAELTGAAAAE